MYIRDVPDIRYIRDILDIRYIKDVPDIWYIRDVPDIRYIRDVPDIRYIRDVPDIRYPARNRVSSWIQYSVSSTKLIQYHPVESSIIWYIANCCGAAKHCQYRLLWYLIFLVS